MDDFPLVIAARFNGPPGSGNGGYSCGVLGALMGDSAEVTLRRPPPLDLPMDLERDGATLRLLHEGALIAESKPGEPALDAPDPVSLEAARAAESGYEGLTTHGCPTCFVCGPARAEGDGLRIFTGPVAGRELVAAVWTPGADLATPDGNVEARVVWSALDCPSYFGGRLRGYGQVALLGRLTAKRLRPVRAGEPHVVVGWPLEHLGRKWEGGAAIFTADGTLCALSRGLWVELKGAG